MLICRERGSGAACSPSTADGSISAGASGFLETDKPENVKSYSRFRFHTVGAARVLNTPNWFMLRDAAGEPKAAAVVRIESTASAQLAEDFCCLIAPIAMAEK
jgi:hypothetical protein